MDGAEVVHAVLYIPHVAKEVFGHLAGRFDGAGWSYWRAVHGIGEVSDRRRWWRVANKVGWDEDEEESGGYGYDGEKIWV